MLVDLHPPVTIRRLAGHYTTNSEAEWLALREALTYALNNFPTEPVVIYSDSKLIVNQFNGQFATRVERLLPLRDECLQLASHLPFVAVQMPKRPSLEDIRKTLLAQGLPATNKECKARQAKWRPRDIMMEKLGH
jgi:ribonuclease HI